MRTKKARPTAHRKTLSDQLREAIQTSELTECGLARASGLDPSTIARFVKGERNWTLETADQVAAVLDLELAGRRTRRS